MRHLLQKWPATASPVTLRWSSGSGAQDQDLGGDLLEQPLEVVAAEARCGAFAGGRDDDAVDRLLLEQPAQRVAVGAPAA